MKVPFRFPLQLALLLAMTAGDGLSAAEIEGVKYGLEEGEGEVAAERLGPFRLGFRIPPSSGAPRILKIDLPESGPKTWPIADVRVVDAGGNPLAVRRPGIEWGKLTIPLPADLSGLVVEAVEPAGGWPVRTSERDRHIEDVAGGVSVRIATWPGGKDAALSFRFDDSDPTHLDLVDPILGEYRFRGTFMVNPGPDEPGSRRRSDFQARLADWKALAGRRDHELANHTAHHRGAKDDEDMDAEIRLAAEIIREVAPHQGRLMALNLGGGTTWTTTRTLRHYLDQHRQFEISGSLGMDDVYGGRVEAFRKHLATHLERGLWARVHYHGIGEGKGASEANFRAALEVANEHRDRIWNAGMTEIHRYQAARDGARLVPGESAADRVEFRVETSTDPTLYDRALEIEAQLPASWKAARVESGEGVEIPHSIDPGEGSPSVRFEIPPVPATYRLRSRT
jgi:peptidoglycan/xylan/chitin deacetylase (PgdA/CDA1 family)